MDEFRATAFLKEGSPLVFRGTLKDCAKWSDKTLQEQEGNIVEINLENLTYKDTHELKIEYDKLAKQIEKSEKIFKTTNLSSCYP